MKCLFKVSSTFVRVGGRIVPYTKYVAVVAALYVGGSPRAQAGEDVLLEQFLNIDTNLASQIAAGNVVAAPPPIAQWVIGLPLDAMVFSDGTKLSVGESAVVFGQRPDGSKHWYDGVIKSINTSIFIPETQGSVASANIDFLQNSSSSSITLKNITSVHKLPDPSTFKTSGP
jgi:hypothetical protein